MNYSYMKVFYTVAKLKNISKASKELNVSQPAVSRIIRNLEDEYDTQLFTRSKEGVKLTKEGLVLFEMIKTPYDELSQIENNTNKTIHLSNQPIKVGVTATALYYSFFDNLKQFTKLYPEINFTVYSNSSSVLLEMVKSGAIDFAFITTPFKSNDSLDVREIYSFKNILIAPKKYENQIKGKVSIKDLKKYPFIFLNKDMQFREHVEQYLSDNGISINPKFETDSSASLIPFVENDCGLTFVPEEMAKKSIESNKCFKVDLIEEMPERTISFIISKEKHHSNIVTKIKEHYEEKSRSKI